MCMLLRSRAFDRSLQKAAPSLATLLLISSSMVAVRDKVLPDM